MYCACVYFIFFKMYNFTTNTINTDTKYVLTVFCLQAASSFKLNAFIKHV